MADVGAEVAALQSSLDALNGRLEVVEHQAEMALEEARNARDRRRIRACRCRPDPTARRSRGR